MNVVNWPGKELLLKAAQTKSQSVPAIIHTHHICTCL